MGEVFRARDTRLDRDVALKILPESFASDPDRRARFEREAKAVAALSHPNILAIFDVGEHVATSASNAAQAHGGRPVIYAAMELLEGDTLRDRLAAGPLPVRKATELGVQIARGLAAAHDRGIVHRDLKPENLFLVSDGQIKILDFGLARHVTAAAGSGATQTVATTDPGTVMGTVGYMAPEQVRGRAVDARADLVSLGVVLYEMVTGQRAFQGASAADTMSALLREDPPDVSGLRRDLSPALDRIIRHCLEKEPDERFQTARDVAFALSSLSGSASSVSGPIAAVPHRSSRRGWLMPAAIAIAAALGGVALGRSMITPPAGLTFVPLTFESQAIFNARFMPDDQTVVFSAAPTGNETSLFELRPDGGAPRPFGPPRTHLLSISRSGELAVLTDTSFVGHRLFRGTLARMTLDGAPRVLASDVREADWMPDGGDLVVTREVSGGDQLEFPIGHVVHRAAGYLSDPRVSPDGTRVAFLEHPEKFDNRGWVKVVDRTGAVTTLTEQYWGAESVAWSTDGQAVIYAGGKSAEYEAFSVRASGGAAPVALMPSPGSLYVHDIAPGGRSIVSREDARYGVAARGAGQDHERDLTVLDQSWTPLLSPDGHLVVFNDGRGGEDYTVITRSAAGSPPARLGPGNIRAISPSGQWVAANIFSTGRCVVYPTGVGAMVEIAMGPLERCTKAVWFPDSQTLLITGNERDKPTRTYRAAFPRGTPQALLPEGVTAALISVSGRRVLAQTADGTWHRWDVDGGSTPLKGLRRDDVPIEWATDELSVLVGSRSTIPATVHRVDVATGQRTPLAEYAPADRAGLLVVEPSAYRDNGRQYAYGYYRRVSKLFLVSAAR